MTNYEKLLAKLAEIFQLDRADLDFGIYRVLFQADDKSTYISDMLNRITAAPALTP